MNIYYYLLLNFNLQGTGQTIGCVNSHLAHPSQLKVSNVVPDRFRRLAHQDFSDYGYLVVAILSHGERASNEDVIIGTDGRQVSLDDITKPFTNGNICKTLIDKLKLFVVQVKIESLCTSTFFITIQGLVVIAQVAQ